MEGYREGYDAKQELDQGKEEQACNERQLKGYEFGKDEEQVKWLAEGHRPGMCISMQQHMLRMVKKAIILDQMEVQMESTETIDGSTQTTTTTIEPAMQTNTTLECQCALLQMEPPDDESSTLTKNAEMMLCIDLSVQTAPSTNETATQTETDPPSSNCPHYQPPPPCQHYLH